MTTASPVLPPFLQNATKAERDDFAAHASLIRLPAGKQVLTTRDAPAVMAFPVAGSLRVYLVSDEGREITLYSIDPGSACVLTASCILGGSGFPAIAVAEQDVVGWVVPAAIFREWAVKSEFWRRYVFQLLGDRLAAVLARLEETAFDRVDRRIARVLLAAGPAWSGTHQRLAADVGTAREVVSRTLERWRAHGWIETRRGCITILNPAAIRTRAGAA